ncbi:LysR substrate-binding domain-containing protein [Sphingobium sp. SCG-1]|uniref:LysR substrate-binding domain-containing protein n=1 Tax=Sphingobium sp. SCG-1 TaxID=2072936 RepID=UPI001CB9D3AA|nr:LysR substrate-binding domain-containing protein [Sphingobium sp. SCG-1]
MKLTHIRDVIAVAERGSLRAAARHLGVAQPAITRSIREVENILGVVLFERHTRGVVTTAMGETFLRRAVVVQNELRLAQDEIEQIRGAESGHISVVLSTASHLTLLPRALERFRRRFPHIVLHVREGLIANCEPLLQDGSCDFYIGPLAGCQPSHQFLVEKLFDSRSVVLARKGHALAGSVSLADLVPGKWLSAADAIADDNELDSLFARNGLPAPVVEMFGGCGLTTLIAAVSSDLLALVPDQWLVLPNIYTMFETINVAEELPSSMTCVVRRAHLPLTPAAEYLCDTLRWASQVYVAAVTHGHKHALFSDKPPLGLVRALG